ncbi:hypothetical protein SUGI_0902270 [Cryptomeria japonica]|nr:hypothetical protein SUGI_0902270 [Cryptomeria japonica]
MIACIYVQKRLSAREPFNDNQKDNILNKLKTSIDELKDKEKQCFLDLGAFPQRKTIPAKALLDIWVYVREMKSSEAKMLLWKFADRHLLDLKKNTGTQEITDDCIDVYSFSQHYVMRDMDKYSFSQHDVMRDLALYLANHDNNIYRRRLYMPKMKDQLPSDWEVLSSKAHTVSIHTGAMKDTDWPQMEFPKVKALVLYFIASEYCIPTFLHTMKNLKVLIIHNADGAKRSKLSGVAGFQELSQLKTLHLERLIVPEEWKLPDEMDKLLSLKKITLFESPGLTALPSSICHLKKLKFLDISSCICLKVNKWRRCELKDTLQRVAKMSSLKRVICDKKNEQLFKSTSRTDLKVHTVVEQEGNLDWLYLKTLNGRN